MTRVEVVIIFLTVFSLIFCDALDSRNMGCSYAMHTFNCSGVGLMDIPEDIYIPFNTKNLDFSFNRISIVTFLNYPALVGSLSTIDLSHNHVSVLREDAFQLFTNLASLNLSNNLLSGLNLTKHIFNGLSKLQSLKLNNNPLRHLKQGTFNYLQLPSLKYLDLSHCKIIDMEDSSLYMQSLVYLDLSWNQLQISGKDSFHRLINLKYLDMSNNRIVVLNEVPSLPELVMWRLDNNVIETVQIRENLQQNADNLHALFLRNNSIKKFDADSFPLEELDYLKYINLTGNPLTCDCHMRWILENGYDFKEKNYSFICSSPYSLRNQNLLTRSPDDLECDSSWNKGLIFIPISVFFSGFLCCMICCCRGDDDEGGNTNTSNIDRQSMENAVRECCCCFCIVIEFCLKNIRVLMSVIDRLRNLFGNTNSDN